MTVYRYTGDSVIVVVIPGGAGLPIDPDRLYDADDLVVVSRPELFEVAYRDASAVETASADPGAKRTRNAPRG